MSCVLFTVRKFTLYFDAHVDDSSTIIILLLEANRYVIGRISESRKFVQLWMTNRRHLTRIHYVVPYGAFYLLLEAVSHCGGGGGSHVVDGGGFLVRFVSINVERVRLAINIR